MLTLRGKGRDELCSFAWKVCGFYMYHPSSGFAKLMSTVFVCSDLSSNYL